MITMYTAILLASFVCIVQSSFEQAKCVVNSLVEPEVPDYYWRDYKGIIPRDAVEGGTDKAGNITYIGQAYIKNFELLPVTIYRGSNIASGTAYALELKPDKNIKILCTTDKGKMQWVPTKSNEMHLLLNAHFVEGGSEIGHTLTLGRVQHAGQIVVGKVFSYPLSNQGLWIPDSGGGLPLNYLSYEILTYDMTKNTNVDVDVRSSSDTPISIQLYKK